MNRFTLCILLVISLSCTTADHPADLVVESAMIDKTETLGLLKVKATDEPYDINLQIGKTENNKYNLSAVIDLYNGSYYASPFSNNDFLGLFDISIEDNDYLALDDVFVETPRSVEEIDPYANVPVNWVKVKTTYDHQLIVDAKKDFEISGMVRFVIEPRCTLEEIEFIISYEGGEMKVRKK